MDRSVTAKKAEDKTFTALGQRDIHILDIEEVTGMLAGQGCSYLAAIQLGDSASSVGMVMLYFLIYFPLGTII